MATIEASVRPELLDASDAVIEDAVAYAEPMILRGLLYQLTGDPALKAIELKKVQIGRMETMALTDEADIALLRRKAADFLKAYRDSGAGPIGYGPRDRLPESLGLVIGRPVEDEALDLMIEETGLDPWARSLKWAAEPDPGRLDQFSVLIIGAGMGGLNSAVQLKRAGIHYHVVEKNPDVGGTWYENKYPGARVDTPSRAYMNIFGVDFPYPFAFGTHEENQKYYEWVADEFDLRGDITFRTEVRALVWDEAASMWEAHVEGPEGKRVLRANAVITGVGFLNRPNIPEIEGMETFRGEAWHTARWPENKDLTGKRIAVIGTGCTGYQLVPELLHLTGHVTVFQRTPQWLMPFPGYLKKVPEQLLWLDRNLPYHTNFMRFRTFYGSGPYLARLFDVDPTFEDPYTVSAGNKAARERSIEFLQSKLSDPALVEVMTPKHPPWSARPVAVDADYSILDVLESDQVTLVTTGLARVNETGIVDGDGIQHDVDVIVYATGFRANDFLYPMTITGKDGVTIEELWRDGGPRAYLGCMMPGFPNLWALYGPNTNGGLPVSQFHEMTMLYAMQCMEKLILEGKESIEVTEEAYWRYNHELDAINGTKLWADPRANNYYWTKHGRTASQIPYTGFEVRNFLLRPNFDDMDIH
jgi:4-hydroxyacetophenone monooxygenase